VPSVGLRESLIKKSMHRRSDDASLRKYFAVVSFAILAMLPGYAFADTTESPNRFSMPGTHVYTLTSQHNEIEYEIRVWLPENYARGGKTYPLTLLLDADYQFPLGVSILEHLAQRDQADESVVVAIAYSNSQQNPYWYRRNRTRDYTPTMVPTGGYGAEFQQYSGGGKKFLRFIADELVDSLRSRYRIASSGHTYVGHSYGGLFGALIIAEQPNLFSNYLLISPSLWYDDRLMIRRIQENADLDLVDATRIYLAVGDHENETGRPMVDELQLYAAAIREKADPAVNVTVRVFNDETHASIYPAALSAGLRHLKSSRDGQE
jgi:predicted alpha/beta superfamily hydrolase